MGDKNQKINNINPREKLWVKYIINLRKYSLMF